MYTLEEPGVYDLHLRSKKLDLGTILEVSMKPIWPDIVRTGPVTNENYMITRRESPWGRMSLRIIVY